MKSKIFVKITFLFFSHSEILQCKLERWHGLNCFSTEYFYLCVTNQINNSSVLRPVYFASGVYLWLSFLDPQLIIVSIYTWYIMFILPLVQWLLRFREFLVFSGFDVLACNYYNKLINMPIKFFLFWAI